MGTPFFLSGPGRCGPPLACRSAMRVGILGILLTLLSAQLVKAEPQYCGSSRLTTAIQYLNWHQKNSYHNQLARYLALEDSSQTQRAAKAIAWTSTILFLFCISILAAAIAYRVLQSKDIAVLLGSVYFGFFSAVLIVSREPIQEVTAEFRSEVSSMDTRDLPEDVTSPGELHRFVRVLKREQDKVSEVLAEKAMFLPSDGRWWTMGWDEVSLVDFQSEVYLASIRKGDFSYRAITYILRQLEKKCRDSGIQI